MPLRQSVNKGGLGNRRAADARAKAVLPTICELESANIVKLTDIMDELNRRRVPPRLSCGRNPQRQLPDPIFLNCF